MRFSLHIPCLTLALLTSAAHATTYYISPSGNNTNNGRSTTAAWATFDHAWPNLYPGDTLIVMDGTYHQRLTPNVRSGSSGSPITVAAQNDGKAIIDGDTNGDGIGELLAPLLDLSYDYFVVTGLIVKNSGRGCTGPADAPCYTVGNTVEFNGTHNIIRRVSGYNAHTDINSIIFAFFGTDNLLEDCVAAGSGRKMIYMFGAAKRNIIRRCFAAWQEWRGRDFNPGNWPWGESIEGYNSSYNLVENSIAYGMAPGPDSGISFFAQGGAEATGNYALGSMSVRIGRKWNDTDMTWPCPSPYYSPAPSCTLLAGWDYRSGFRLGNNGENTHDNYFQDIFAWGNGGYGFHLDINTGGTNTLTRGTLVNNGLGGGEDGTDFQNSDKSLFRTWTDNYVEGVDTAGRGARLIYQYQSSWNSNNTLNINLTSTPLWPWPMEDRIKSELGVHLSAFVSINPQLQNFSVTSAMQSIFNSLPAAINPLGTGSSDTQAPTTPAGLTATAVSSSQINLAWSPSTDNVGVMGYRVFRNGTQINTTTATSYSDTGLNASTAYSYNVAAYDAAGNVSSQCAAASATTQAAADVTPPTVSITAPSAGASLSGSVTVSATASDNVAVAGVQFKLDGVSLGSEDTSSPYTISWNTTATSNGAHALTALARDAAGNSTTSTAVSVVVSNASSGSLAIAGVSDNLSSYPNSQVPKYSKLELTFQVDNTVATNFQLPYDPSPPAGIDPSNYPMHKGISVDALFTPDNWQTTYRQPAFYYESYDDQVKPSWDGQNREWHLPTGSFAWKVRFSPTQTGNWQYKLVAQDASGTAQSPAYAFTVTTSTNHGFLRVSPTDPRYFEYQDGTPFYPMGINTDSNIADPVLGNNSFYSGLTQNGINLLRIWISNIYGSAWLEWLGGRNLYDGYLPRAGLEAFHDSLRNRDQLTQVLKYDGANLDTAWYDACRFQFWDDPESVKPNTNYKLSIKYWGTGIAGPRVSGKTNFGLVGKISSGWVTDCYEPGTGTVITNYGGNTSDWGVLQGTWNSGSNNFLPRIYLGLENATQGKVFIDSVSLREDLGNGQYGPEIITESSMQYDMYFPQEPSYSLDKIISLAETYGIELKLVLSDLNDAIYLKQDDDGTYVINGEPDNADGFYGRGRTVNRTRWLQQAWWRYVQARWGYSTSVHSWELTNEGDPFLLTHWQMTDEFGKFMHCRVFGVDVGNADGNTCTLQHPNRHMTTTSFWHSFPGYYAPTGEGFWGNPSYPNVDYADVHAYISTSPAPLADRTAMQWDSAYYHLWHSSQFGGWKFAFPVVRGEAGMDLADQHATTVPGLQSDMPGQWYHDYVWSSLDSGGLYEMYWWYIPDIYNEGVYDHRPSALSFKNFLNGIPLSNGHYQDLAASASDSNLRVVGQKDLVNGKAHFWIQNKNHTWKNVLDGVSIAPVTGTVTIAGFAPNQTYTLSWWNTYATTGQVVSTTSATAASNGNLTVSVQSLSSDVAVKITPSGQTPVNQAPVANAGPDLAGVVGVAVTLNGAASDDGLPSGSTLTTTWSKVSGPGTVTFANAAAKVTTATFSAVGTYVVRLTASDSLLSTSDDCTVVVTAAADTTPPVISGVSVTSITASGAVINWSTDEAADQQVDYGTTTSYGQSSVLSSTLSTSHSVTLSSLASGTLYHYRVRSRDGSGNSSVSTDRTFTTSGTAPVFGTWSTVSVATRPPVRWGPKLAYHAVRQTVILYGGDAGTNYTTALDDMWEFNGSTWTKLCGPCSPGGRAGHALVYDSVRNRLVLFGGWNSSGYRNDVWEWDGTSWTLVVPGGASPTARRGVYAAYDAARGRTVIFGGVTSAGTSMNDVYEYNGTNWFGPLAPATRPGVRNDPTGPAVFDAGSQKTLIYGGNGSSGSLDDLWAWDGSSWTQVCAPCTRVARSGASMTLDQGTAQLIVANGWTGTSEIAGSGALIGGTWLTISATQPSARDNASMVYDVARGKTVLFGGNGTSCSGNCNDTLAYVSVPPAPALVSPSNGATGTSLAPSLSWSASSGATSYDIYLGTASSPPYLSNTTSTSYSPGTLTSGTLYYWRVVAKNSIGSRTSLTWSFTTQVTAPPAPALVSPANGATGVGLTPSLSWNTSTGATSYDVYFGTASSPPYVTNTTATSYSPGTLTSGTLYYWRIVAKNSGGSNSSAAWSFTTAGKAVGDFDGNGKPDVIWQNKTTGQASVWFMGGSDGLTVLGFGWLNATGTSDWRIVGAADFDGNGKPDVIWQNGTTGQASVWFMGGSNGLTVLGFGWLNATGTSDWRIVGAADFDGNGKPDVIWQNTTTGQASVWFMGGSDGLTVLGFGWLNATGDAAWNVVGASDFDGNGKPDVIWQNKTTGQASVWFMGGSNGLTVLGFGWLNATGDAAWNVVGASDFDGNGKPDVIWQNKTTGKASVWFMGGSNGMTVLGLGWLNATDCPGWQVL